MKIQRTQPIANFDTETTHKNPALARICQIAFIKLMPDNSCERKEMLINPGIPIPPEATEVHGITDEMVANAPKFSQIARSLHDFIDGCILCAYNGEKYDIVLLMEEFLRAGIEWDVSNLKTIDPYIIMTKKEERNLGAALKFYTNKELVGAHGAMADTEAALNVLSAQTQVYPDLAEMTIEELCEFSKYDGAKKVDLSGCFVYNEQGQIVFSFGKNEGKLVHNEQRYLEWMKGADFTLDTKRHIEKLLKLKGKK